MNTHLFNMDAMLVLGHEERYGHLKFAYGTFDLCLDEENEIVKVLVEWCNENCIGDHTIFDTHASYTGQGVQDVTVIAFEEESDAVGFKLRWL